MPKSRSYDCDCCETTFGSLKDYTTHHGRFVCPERGCNRQEKSLRSLYRHITDHDKEGALGKYEKYLRKTFAGKGPEGLSHAEITYFKCDYCTFQASNLLSCTKHIARAHKRHSGTWVCSDCRDKSPVFTTKRNLSEHFKTYHLPSYKVLCIVCRQDFKSKRAMYRHVRNDHDILEKNHFEAIYPVSDTRLTDPAI